jgi:hypothetical protein
VINAPGVLQSRCFERAIEVVRSSHVQGLHFYTQCLACSLRLFEDERSATACKSFETVAAVDEQSKGRRPGEQLTREFEPLRPDFDA